MSLFKIMKGSKNRLDNQELHEGYAWYTTEDGGFYIDASDVDAQGDDVPSSLSRTRVNEASNTSFSAQGMSATNVHDAIIEVNKSFTYDSTTKTLELS